MEQMTVRMCHRHERQRVALERMNRDWAEDQEPRWIGDMIAQCLDCRSITGTAPLTKPSADGGPWPVAVVSSGPLSPQERRKRASRKRPVGRQRIVRSQPNPMIAV